MADYTGLVEQTGDNTLSPGQLHFNFQNQRARRSWHWMNPNGTDSTVANISVSDRQNLTRAILGDTDYPVDPAQPGRLSRVLPLADSEFPYLYASDILDIKGFGSKGMSKELPQLNTNDATFPGFTQYPNYEVIVECVNRPYPIAPNSSILPSRVTWTDVAGASQTFTYFPEWLRFCDWDFTPQDNWIYQQRGTAYFRTASGAEPGLNAGPAQFPGQVRRLLPDSILRLKWDMVPARYVLSTNSFLNKFRGFVNQNGWNGPLGPVPKVGDTTVFPTGSLLFLNYKSVKYSPVRPISVSLFGSFIDYSKLMDIELYFLHTQRVGNDLPTPGGNAVAGGHNLQLYFPKAKFYYAEFKDYSGNVVPLYQSFPIELLFSDPDAAGTYQGTG